MLKKFISHSKKLTERERERVKLPVFNFKKCLIQTLNTILID